MGVARESFDVFCIDELVALVDGDDCWLASSDKEFDEPEFVRLLLSKESFPSFRDTIDDELTSCSRSPE